MMLAPAVTVHGIAHARMALQPGCPVVLLSGPGAGLYAGAGWWCALLAQVRAGSDPAIPALLDCADAPGAAMAALRAGAGGIVLAGDCPAYGAVDRAARSIGAIVLPHRPVSLDLAQPGAARRLHAWLQRDINPPLR